MKRHALQTILLSSYFIAICTSIPWLANAATGDIIFSYKGASGQTQSVITPGTSTNLLTLNGAGLVSTLARSTFLTPSGDGSSLTGLTKSQVGLGSVENTAISTWTGSANITTLGTITTGTFSGTLGAISGASLTSLNASNLASGTVATARLGTGTASSSTYLRGDSTWAAITAGTVTSMSIVTANGVSGSVANASTTPAVTLSLGAITPSSVNGLTVTTSTGTLTIPNGVTLTGPASSGTVAVLGNAQTFTAAQTISTAGAASTPVMALTGTLYTGGSATTTKPLLLVEPVGTTSTNWSTSGTQLGINAASGFAGNALQYQLNNVIKFQVDSAGAIFGSGAITSSSTITAGSTLSSTSGALLLTDVTYSRFGAGGVVQHNTGGTVQEFRVAGSNLAGGKYAKLGHDGTNAYLGTSTSGGAVTMTAPLALKSYTVATLPSTAATGMVAGAMAYVTDALAPTYNGALTGGSSTVVPVFYNGSAWVAH